ncbi:MAG: ABC transporter permease, partial [Betaproteobacteria bacterium]|nr:ABC transporter permease [Betaproteobacteria bacterium]
TNVVAVFIICITFIPILYASYITRNTTEVEGSSK